MKHFGICSSLILGLSMMPLACASNADLDDTEQAAAGENPMAPLGTQVDDSNLAETAAPSAPFDTSSIEVPDGFRRLPNGEITRYFPREVLGVPELDAEGQGKLQAFMLTLPAPAADSVSLRKYQTTVKDQNPYGACVAFATVGAIEAAYMRRCMDDANNNEEYCGRLRAGWLSGSPAELDLSEQYWNVGFFSGASTRNPSAQHENQNHMCGISLDYAKGDNLGVNGAWSNTVSKLLLPEENYAPCFGDGTGTRHINHFGFGDVNTNDSLMLRTIINESGPYAGLPGDGFCGNTAGVVGGTVPNPGIQQRFDHFNYDPSQVSYDAAYQARYGISELQAIPQADARDPATLERFLAAKYEVVLGIDLRYLHCLGQPQVDGAEVCKIDLNKAVDEGHHAVLAVGYDRINKRILVKNSWGNSYPFIWLPYDYLRSYTDNAVVVVSVQPAVSPNHEAAARGLWHVYNADGSYAGRMAIHRTRDAADALPNAYGSYVTATEDSRLMSKARLGTFYPWNGTALGSPLRMVGNMVNGSLAIYKGDSAGNGGDLVGWGYGGESWGSLQLESADKARDGVGHIYLRDFANRAQKNWIGKWSLELGTPTASTATLYVDAVNSIRSLDGTYAATGRYVVGSSTYNVTGRIDRAGAHGRFTYRTGCSAFTCLNTVTVDANLQRGSSGGVVRDFIVEGSNVITSSALGSSSKTLWGLKFTSPIVVN